MARGKKNTPEQIVSLLRQVEVAVASGKPPPSTSASAMDARMRREVILTFTK
jgi:hypothetical protein